MALDFEKMLSETANLVNQMSKMEENKDVEGLSKILREKKNSSAAAMLGNIGDARAVKPLAEALQYDRPDVRRAATSALGKIDDPGVIEPLIQALDDRDDDVRRRAAEALGSKADASATDALQSALDRYEDAVTQDAVRKALEQIKAGK